MRSEVEGDITSSGNASRMMDYWVKRMSAIGTRLKIYGLSTDSGVLDIDIKNLLTFYNQKSNDKLKDDFGSATVVYQQTPTAPAMAKSDTKSLLEIANELKEAVHYEFFMDVNGELVFKMPFYNLDVRNNVSSVLKDLDIINWNFIQSESEVITRVDVTGQLCSVSNYSEITNGVSRDPWLAVQFGERMIQRSMPWLHTDKQCNFWGKAELVRQNALIRQGSVTILGRPELRLGYPVFIPSRDAFYYIKGIENRFSFGGSFTTTLTLSAERTKTVNKNSIFRNVGEIKDEQLVVLGDSIAEPNETNNFVKQISMPNICTPRAKEHVTIVQPVFATDLSNTTEKFGEWKTFSDVVEPNEDGEFQITDYDSYEIIGQVGVAPYITYGYGLEYGPQGSIGEKLDTDKNKSDAQRALAMKAQNMQLEVDPNNSMFTLDSTTGRMISYGTTDAANKAMNAKPEQT